MANWQTKLSYIEHCINKAYLFKVVNIGVVYRRFLYFAFFKQSLTTGAIKKISRGCKPLSSVKKDDISIATIGYFTVFNKDNLISSFRVLRKVRSKNL